jgi:hypothetical protein
MSWCSSTSIGEGGAQGLMALFSSFSSAVSSAGLLLEFFGESVLFFSQFLRVEYGGLGRL